MSRRQRRPSPAVAAPGGRPSPSAAAPSHRSLRVAEQMRHLLAEHLARGEAHEPELDARSLTISEVRLSPDLRSARVFASELGRPLSDAAMAALQRVAGRLAGRLGREMNLKYAPRLQFVPDELFDHAARLERVLMDERGRINPANADADADAATEEDDADARA